MSASRGVPCDVPGCGLVATALVANDVPLTSPDYAERNVCRWHLNNPFGDQEVEA